MSGKTPPVPPPRPRQPLSAEAIQRLSTSHGLSPLAFNGDDGYTEQDEEDREAMFERLQQYYLHYEGERVQQGIGHIVDWTMTHGVVELDARLVVKYGESLQDFEERMAKEKARAPTGGPSPLAESFMQRANGSFYGAAPQAPSPQMQRPVAPSPPPGLGIGSAPKPVAAAPMQKTVRDRLMAFYARFDTDRLHKGVDDLVDYVARKGLPALNEKLVKKFGITLEDFEAGKQPGTVPPPSPAMSTASGFSQAPAAGQPGRMSMRSILRRSFRARTTEAAQGNLPAYVRPLLELFYSKYDQSKINSGGVDAIYKWAQKKSYAALNMQLKTKYLEDLEEFAERMGKMREDLEAFYRVHAPDKLLNGGVDAVLRWGVRQGRAAVNAQLRKAYGADLENMNASSAANAEPDF